MQFGFMPGSGTTDTLFVAKKMQENYTDEERDLFVCFVNTEKPFDRVRGMGDEEKRLP